MKSVDRINEVIRKIYWKEILAVLLLLIAVYFFRSERRELVSIFPNLQQAERRWVITGILVTAIYILLQSLMYVTAFAAIGSRLSLDKAIELFLKRNFLSVFLPAGGVSSLAYTPSRIRKSGFNKMQIHQASGIYAFSGMTTVFVIGIPLVIYTLSGSGTVKDVWMGLVLVAITIGLILFIVNSLRKKGILYLFLQKRWPSVIPSIDDLFTASISNSQMMKCLLCSLGVELTGIFHVYIAMMALGLSSSILVAALAYTVSVLLMIASPFLRGLGAVELSMVYVLNRYGFSPEQSLSVTILYRVFEFWIPLAAGIIAFAWKGRQIFVRLFPALLVFILGAVNIISVVTPPLAGRLKLLREFIPAASIRASNLLVMLIGLTLIVTAAFLIRGLRNAWIIALVFASVSLVGHITKALDYEESMLAAFTILVLALSAGSYRMKSHQLSVQIGLITVGLVFLSILLFGFIGFYFVDVRHFGVDFTWKQSIVHAGKSFFLLSDDGLQPITRFGHEFVWLMNGLGFVAWGYLVFTLVRPYLQAGKKTSSVSTQEKARLLLNEYGSSPVDYFKTNDDKLLYFSDSYEAFIAYRIANAFAIVLEEPVCADEDKVPVLREFDEHCKKMGLKTAFYRVDEDSMIYFDELKKRKLLIGQEAIADVSKFTLEGKDKKSLRNGLNSLQKKGYQTIFYKAPQSSVILAELKQVSDEWLRAYDKKEMIFAQGMFDEKLLKAQDIIAIGDAENKIVAFTNIIPDFARDECTYDLIRKKEDAPAGCMDALIVELINYAKLNNRAFLNLGLVPMSGIVQPDSTAERVVKYAYEKIRRFRHYQGLREFKEKYASVWANKYLVYENDFDLLQLPAALNKVMQPVSKQIIS
ncbi:MAG: transporter permease [Chitinophagaceae bacterium]|nr:transporter permease [Chitinophagaceae bacterium]